LHFLKKNDSTTVIYVTRAIILQDNHILAAMRPETMSLAFKWDLPGGKLEEDESPEEALVRETMEEMNVLVRLVEPLPFVDRAFKGKHYRFLPYVCELVSGTPIAVEHAEVRWQPIEHLFDLDWAPGEELVLRKWAEMDYLRENHRAKVATV
jgi:8-oxo-dGTP diphosphatase